jgi:hypothetical protein
MRADRRGAAPEGGSDQPAPRGRKRGSRLLKLVVLGGALALVLNEDLRSQVLDALFGAEEEFTYSSVTEPSNPASPPETPSQPWVRSEARDADVASEPDPPDDDFFPGSDPVVGAEDTPRANSTIAPSPAAWRAAADEQAADQPSPPRTAPEPTVQSEARVDIGPPTPPPAWWRPSKPDTDPVGD